MKSHWFAVLFGAGLLALTSVADDTVSRPLTEKQKKYKAKMVHEVPLTPYGLWLRNDAAYIIGDEERTAFKRLTVEDERERFVEQFWLRRDPTPDTVENEAKEEHYRRVLYANEHFGSRIPGWKTDRGRIYIMHGPPDEIEAHPANGDKFASEHWRYPYIKDVGSNVAIEFLNYAGDFRMTMPPAEKDPPLYVPGRGQTLAEQMGLTTGHALPKPEVLNGRTAPAIKFKDLIASVNTPRFSVLPMRVRVDYLRATLATTMATITVEFDKIHRDSVRMLGLVTDIPTRRPLDTFEYQGGEATFQHSAPLLPGRYRLTIHSKDDAAKSWQDYEVALEVPKFDEEKLSASSLVAADRVSSGGELGVSVQFYNFGPEEKTFKPDAEIQYEIVKSGSGEKMVDFTEAAAAIPGASCNQVTIRKLIPVKTLPPGRYELRLRVTDRIRNQTIVPSAKFTVI